MAHLEVDPTDGLLDDPLVLRVAGLAPRQEVVVDASAVDGAGRRWRARATATADDAGRATVDGARLVTSMGPGGDSWPAGGPFQLRDSSPLTIDLLVLDDAGSTLASAAAKRRLAAWGVEVGEVEAGAGFRGTLCRPPGGRPGPAVLDLGAGGAPTEARAALLASHGFLVLALDRSDAPLVEHPLDPVEAAVRWLGSHGAASGRRIAVIGSGRGGELALLTGASWPQLVGAVVGWAASGVVLAGDGDDGGGRSAWSYRGVPVPFLRAVEDLRDPDLRAAATIPVERLDCPVLLVTGGADGVWPAHTLAGIARDRLALHRHRHEVKHLRYIAAGHLLGLPNLPAGLAAGDMSTFGGRPDADARASADSWPQVVAFLHRSLAAG